MQYIPQCSSRVCESVSHFSTRSSSKSYNEPCSVPGTAGLAGNKVVINKTSAARVLRSQWSSRENDTEEMMTRTIIH